MDGKGNVNRETGVLGELLAHNSRMTNLIILSEEEIQAFESPPRFRYEERKHFFTIPEWAEPLFARLATPASKVGFILQLGYFRATNKFYSKELFYPEDMAFVQKRMGTPDPWQAALYSERMTERHRIVILNNLGYTAFSPGTATTLSGEAERGVEKQMRLKDIFGQLLGVLDQKKIAVPRYSVLAAIITNEFRRHEKWMVNHITGCLTQEDKQLLYELLNVDEKMYESSEKRVVMKKRPRVTLLKKFHQSIRPEKIKENIAELFVIQNLFTRFAPVCEKLKLARPMIEHYATITIKVRHFQIERRNELRYLYLLCFIVHQYYTLNDRLVDKLVRIAQTANNKAKKAQQDTYYATREERLLAAGELANAGESTNQIVEQATRIVFSESADSEKISKLKTLLRRDRQYSTRDTRAMISKQRNEEKRALRDADYLDALSEQSLWLQTRLSEIVKHFRFNEDTSQKTIMAAITHFQKAEGKLSSRAPVGCFSKKERRAVLVGKKDMRVSLYKALLFKRIGKALKSERLNLKYSYTHRALADYLIFTQNCVTG